ncbi:MAG: caspase family protein [Rubrivivax sp.]|nr:caspase family protein [Pyrinomonadaceae bacterium]
MKFLARALPITFVLLAVLLPPPARMQERGVGVSPAPAVAGGYHALVIGNNDYRSLPKLKTAEMDARQVAALLKEFYGFETTLLINATRQQIVSALAASRRRLGSEARLLVYYAGHGYNDREQDKAYWLPVDAERDDPANWIIADEITSAIRVIPARHVLVVSDSCYSGTLTRGLGEALPPASERERFIEKMASGRSRMLMASGGNEPVADGGGGGHSVFANALLRGLREMDRGRFTAAELFRNYVVERVAGRAEQTPEYNPIRNSGHDSGDFVFVRVKTADGKTVEVTVKTPTAGTFDTASVELSFWETIKGSSNPEDFKAYLKQYPAGQFASLANIRIASLEAPAKPAATSESALPSGGSATELAFWDSIKNSANAEDYKAYLEKYPKGEFATLAKNRLVPFEAAAREKEKERATAEDIARRTKTFSMANQSILTVSPAKIRIREHDSGTVFTCSNFASAKIDNRTINNVSFDEGSVLGSDGKPNPSLFRYHCQLCVKLKFESPAEATAALDYVREVCNSPAPTPAAGGIDEASKSFRGSYGIWSKIFSGGVSALPGELVISTGRIEFRMDDKPDSLKSSDGLYIKGALEPTPEGIVTLSCSRFGKAMLEGNFIREIPCSADKCRFNAESAVAAASALAAIREACNLPR